MNDAIDVRPVETRRELNTFIKLPWRIYKDEPHWVPPLLMDLKKQLDRDKNPWFKHAEAEYFLAWKGDRPVGRISAQVDKNFNDFQQNDWGLFGFFECENDPAAAQALFDAAAAWLRARGRDRMVGPMNFTTNDECGVLIDGHDFDPMILEPWTPRYYPGLFEGADFDKAMDLLMWRLELEDESQVNPVIWKFADKVDAEGRYKLRRFSKKTIDEDVDHFLDIYNASWEKNWGFVPLEEAEVRHYAKTLKPILDPNWAFLLHTEDETVGAALTLPDFNQVLKRINGRLLPFGWIKALWYQRKIDRVRVFALGVKPEYQKTGIAARLYTEHYKAAHRTGVKGGSMGWILEVNKPMNRAMEAMGGTIDKRFRLYERPL